MQTPLATATGSKRPPEPPLPENIPDDHTAVARSRVERRAVGAEDRPESRGRMARESLPQPASWNVPRADAAVVRRCREPLPVGAEGKGVHPTRCARLHGSPL